jgi:hypothetical protein
MQFFRWRVKSRGVIYWHLHLEKHFQAAASDGLIDNLPGSSESCCMNSPKRRALRALFTSASLFILSLATPAPLASDNAAAPAGETPTAANRGETRLRKLHLVRPDLIPYPIAFEVYC